MTGDSDEALVRDYASGNERAFERLLDRYRDRVTQLVRGRLGSRSLWVDDVAQDVFVQLHRRARSFEGRSSFKTWLYAIALNICRDHLRRERTPASRQTIEADNDGMLAALPDESLDPLQLLERDERDALVRAAVEQLTSTHRTVLQLRDHEDLSYEEIAKVLAVPVGTVRSRLHNARAAFAQALTESLRGN